MLVIYSPHGGDSQPVTNSAKPLFKSLAVNGKVYAFRPGVTAYSGDCEDLFALVDDPDLQFVEGAAEVKSASIADQALAIAATRSYHCPQAIQAFCAGETRLAVLAARDARLSILAKELELINQDSR
jgi:hypothetical protein